MSSSQPPTYYFPGVSFNNAYYLPTSTSAVSLSTAKKIFLLKNGTDTAFGPITFSSTTNISQALNLTSSTNAGTLNFTDSAYNIYSQIYGNASSISIDFMNLANGFSILNNGVSVLNALSNQITLSLPYSLSYSSLPTLTTAQVGFSHGSVTTSSITQSASGSNVIYNSSNQVQLPIGVYQFNATFAYAPNAFTGTIQTGTGFQIGYTLGTNATPSTNTKTAVYSGVSNVSLTNFTGNFPFTLNAIVNVTTANSYIAAYLSYNLSAFSGGNVAFYISNYTVIRVA